MSTVEDEDKSPPVGGGGGIPIPKEARTYGNLPFLSRRQTYYVIIAIPVVQLALIFLSYLLAITHLYTFSPAYFLQLTGFSLLTGLYQWYMAKFSGSCRGVLISIYTLVALNLVHILYAAVNLNQVMYSTFIAGAGLLLSVLFFRRAR